MPHHQLTSQSRRANENECSEPQKRCAERPRSGSVVLDHHSSACGSNTQTFRDNIYHIVLKAVLLATCSCTYLSLETLWSHGLLHLLHLPKSGFPEPHNHCPWVTADWWSSCFSPVSSRQTVLHACKGPTQIICVKNYVLRMNFSR